MGASSYNSVLLVKYNAAVVGNFRTMNFTGAGVVVTDAGGGQVNVAIGGGSTAFWKLNGNTEGGEKYIGTNDAFDFPIYTSGTRRMTVLSTGDIGIGTALPLGTVQIDTPASDSLTKDSLILSHVNTGLTPAVETGLRFKVWINNFANDSARIYSYSTSVNSGDQHLAFQVLNNSSGYQTYVDIGSRDTKFATQYYSLKFTLTDAATIALDWINSNVQYVELGGNRTFTFANPKDGGRYIIMLKQGGAGNFTVTWPAEVLWPGGVAPTLSTAIGAVDIITFVYDGTNSVYYSGSNLSY